MGHGHMTPGCPHCFEDRLVDTGQGLHVCFSCFREIPDEELRREISRNPCRAIDLPKFNVQFDSKILAQSHGIRALRPTDQDLLLGGVETLDSGFIWNEVCDHLCHVVSTRDGDAVCGSCGSVIFSGVDAFHVAGLEGAAYTYRKGTYQIRYYHNEKCAQWSRECPRPSEQVIRRFIDEIKNQCVHGHPSKLGRQSVAAACKRIGRPTMQEKWILLLEICKQRDPDFFRDTYVPPKPSVRLVNEMRRLFLVTLPAWEMCKDIDAGSILKSRYPKIKLPNHYGKRRRKSYPHNYMMRRFLLQIQLWNSDQKNPDPELSTSFDTHHEAIKTVSDRIQLWWDVIYEKMCENMNDVMTGESPAKKIRFSYQPCK